MNLIKFIISFSIVFIVIAQSFNIFNQSLKNFNFRYEEHEKITKESLKKYQ